MKKQLSRRHIVASAAGVGAVALAACGAQGAQAPTAQSVKPTTIIWTSWATAGAELERIQEQQKGFATAAPQVTVNIQNTPSGTEYYTKLFAQLSSGSGPDVFRSQSPEWEDLAKSGSLMEVAPLIAKEPKSSGLQNIYPSVLPSTKFRGKMYGIPFASTYMVLYVNKPLWNRLGVALPPAAWAQSAWTWDAMLGRLRSLTKKPDSFGTPLPSIGNRLNAMLFSNNAPTFNEALTETLITRPEYYEGLQWIADLRNVHGVATTTAENRENTFQNGKVAMSMSITAASLGSTLTTINNAFEIDLFPVPVGPKSTKPGTLNSLSLWVMNKESKSPDAAWLFTKYLGSPEGMDPELRRGFSAPIYPGVEQRFMVEYPQLNKAAVIEAAKYASPLLNPPGYSEIEKKLTEGITEVYEGRKAARQMVTELAPSINEMIKQASRA
ncbi:MAG TPA: sugar ABC transporter substrate-binding protein [Chloroflexota bacterium]|jgi:multiple sugar transport system substrate-binding protein|nr:sugar ABC transporter substrate-binding protein [Chloroflexota bacterium]